MNPRTEQPRHQIDPAAVLATALNLAATGWPVFPCVPGGKRPLTGHGMLDATRDPDQIRTWWRRTPTANLAVPTGAGTIDVLDVDVRATGSGFPAFNAVHRAGLLPGYSRVVATPSGGIHVYFTGTDQPSSRLPSHHLDLKASGGYVLVPPSVVDGRLYEVVRRAGRRSAPLDWAAVRALLDPPAPPPARGEVRQRDDRGGIAALARWVEGLPEGRRNAGAYWAACRAVEQGIDDLAPLVDAAVRAGLPEREAARTIASAQRLRPATPTTAPGRRGGRGRS